MTARETKIKAMQMLWADLTKRKNEIVQELWTIENKMDNLKTKLKEYGTNLEMAENSAMVD